MAGFGALMFSGFTSIRFFGYLVIISIGSCLIGSLVIIPAFLMKYKPGFLGFETGKKKTEKNEKENQYYWCYYCRFYRQLHNSLTLL